MKRRQFIQSLAALFTAPALPAKALLAAPAATSSAAAVPNLYTWSVMIARTRGDVSASMLARALHIDVMQATGLVNRMVSKGVLGSANAIGLHSAQPVFQPQNALDPRLAAKAMPQEVVKVDAPKAEMPENRLKFAEDEPVEPIEEDVVDEETDVASDETPSTALKTP